MERLIVITGTAGTGKSTLARYLGRKIGADVIGANDLVKRYRLGISKDRYGTVVVDIGKLEKKAAEAAKNHSKKKNTLILEGHLLSEIKVRGAVAIVLREHLPTIIKRLEKRRYAFAKIRDNVISEAIDLCGSNSEKRYKRVYEVIGSSARNDALHIIRNGRIGRKKIDLMPELLSLIKKNKDLLA